MTEDLAGLIYNKLVAFIAFTSRKSVVASTPVEETDANTSAEIRALEKAFQTQVLYIVGKEQLNLAPSNNFFSKDFFRRITLNTFIWIRDLTKSKVQEMNVPIDRLVEVGFIKEL